MLTIICDWNRTLLRDYAEQRFFGGLFARVVLRAAWRLDFRRLWLLAGAAARCLRLYLGILRRPEAIPRNISRIVGLLNRWVLPGLGADFLAEYTWHYARHAAERLDMRLVECLRELRAAGGVRLGVISSGYVRGIERALRERQVRTDFIVANDFVFADARAVTFRLDVMDNKEQVLLRTLRRRGIAAADVAYVGDSIHDAGCLRRVGFPVVAFWAGDADKRRFAAECGAFVPADAAALRDHLLAALREVRERRCRRDRRQAERC